jgi:hypothetical protein
LSGRQSPEQFKLKNYATFKEEQKNAALLTNFTQIKKAEVRETSVGQFLDKAKESFNDWEKFE